MSNMQCDLKISEHVCDGIDQEYLRKESRNVGNNQRPNDSDMPALMPCLRGRFKRAIAVQGMRIIEL